MKLSTAVLATVCAAGCEIADPAQPLYPDQPAETYEVADPRIEAVEVETQPIEPAVSPVKPVVQPRVVQQPKRRPHIDDCPGCGMG